MFDVMARGRFARRDPITRLRAVLFIGDYGSFDYEHPDENVESVAAVLPEEQQHGFGKPNSGHSVCSV